MSAIDDKYAALGGPGGFLGHPMTRGPAATRWTPPMDGAAAVIFRAVRSIGLRPPGAHEVHGDIRNHWASMGWENSFLRYPISDERPDGSGRFSQFQGGSIHWTPDGAIDVR